METRKILTYAVLIVCAGGLAACGDTKGERALSGGAIGAGAGAVGGALTGGSPWTGAVIGGAAGAATGALTDEDDIDLDD
jgi:osmotically inducible lipoprotein OsmB